MLVRCPHCGIRNPVNLEGASEDVERVLCIGCGQLYDATADAADTGPLPAAADEDGAPVAADTGPRSKKPPSAADTDAAARRSSVSDTAPRSGSGSRRRTPSPADTGPTRTRARAERAGRAGSGPADTQPTPVQKREHRSPEDLKGKPNVRKQMDTAEVFKADMRSWVVELPDGMPMKFRSTRSARKWLKSMSDFEGLTASCDRGKTFKPILEWDAFEDITPRTRRRPNIPDPSEDTGKFAFADKEDASDGVSRDSKPRSLLREAADSVSQEVHVDEVLAAGRARSGSNRKILIGILIGAVLAATVFHVVSLLGGNEPDGIPVAQPDGTIEYLTQEEYEALQAEHGDALQLDLNSTGESASE